MGHALPTATWQPTTSEPGNEIESPSADSLGLWTAHVAALLAVFTIIMLVVGPGVFTIDEQAYRFQTELVNEGTWGLAYPTAPIIDQDLGAPISNSERGDNFWYPAARHPAYIQLLRAGHLIDDYYGPVLVSLVGLLLASIGVEQVARWLGGVPRWSAFWFVGLASPAAFHGLVTWAHAPALGLVSVGLALMLRARPDRLVVTAGGIAALACSAILRSDAPLAIAAIGAGLLVPVRHDQKSLFRFVATGVSGVIGLGTSTLWHGATVEESTVAGAGSGRSLDLGRYLSTASEILLTPGPGLASLRLISVALFITALWWFRRIGSEGRHATLAITGAATALGVIGSFHSSVYGSLFPAAPVLAVGLVGLVVTGANAVPAALGDRACEESPQRRQRVLVLTVMAVAGVVAPILATVSGGGGLGWGGRYVLLALAPLVPLALAGLHALWQLPSTRLIAVGALVVTVAVQGAGLRTLIDAHSGSLAATPLLTDALPALGEEFDLIATVDPRVGRMAPRAASDAPLVSVQSADDLVELLAVADRTGLSTVAVVSFFESVEPDLPTGWSRIEYRDEPLHVLVVGR